MLSFWEKSSFIQYDYIIIGAGITGLSTACTIKEKNPKAKVLVLDKGMLPTGASTKNAGFACIGSFSEKWSDYQRLGEAEFLKIIHDRWKGLYLLRKRLGDDNIDFLNYGGYELILNQHNINTDHVSHLNKLLHPLFNQDVFFIDQSKVNHFGFNSNMVENIIYNPFEGQLDTGKMMTTLLNYAGMLQVRVLMGINVNEIETLEHGVKVHCTSNENAMSFMANQLAICTNAFTKAFLPDEEIIPGRGQVLCTSEIPNLKFKGIFHFDEGYYYFRNIGNRIIFGGGRNIDFETETTTSFQLNERIQKQLLFFLEEMIIPDTDFKVEHQWSGIMAFNEQKTPLLKRVNNHVVVGARLNGMGVALASKIAEDLTNMMINL
jgi:gamma-glutamylputrescine oxidase